MGDLTEDSTTAGRGCTVGHASYPATYALTGRVDPRTGRVSIVVPSGTYHLNPGDVLHGLQAFSMTGLLPRRTIATSLYIVDSTPAQSAAIGGAAERPGAVLGRGSQPPGALPATGAGESGLGVLLLAGSALLARARYTRTGRHSTTSVARE